MKKVKLFLLLTLPLMMLFACQRVYPDGYTEEISPWQAAYDIVVGKPARKEVKPLEKMKLTGDPIVDTTIIAFNKTVDKENERIKKHNKGAQDDKEDPDTGLLSLLGALATAGGLGWAKAFLNKRTAEAGRDLATDEKRALSAMYQASKDVIRDDVGLLSKVKKMANIAANSAREQKDIYEEHGDTVAGMKRAYAEITSKNL